MRLLRILLTVAIVTLVAVMAIRWVSSEATVGKLTPESVNAKRLSDVSRLSGEEGAAARAVIVAIGESGQDPREFFVTSEREGDILLLDVRHESSFQVRNRDLVGDPTGLSRTYYYSMINDHIIKVLRWQ